MQEKILKQKFNQLYPKLYNLSLKLHSSEKKVEHTEYLDFHKKRFYQTLKFISETRCNENPKLLEVGAGYLSILSKLIFNCSVSAIDKVVGWEVLLDEFSIPMKECDLLKDELPYEANTFDIVLHCEVLEHLPVPPYKTLLKIKKVMKNNGMLIISTPNIAAIAKRIKGILGMSPLDLFGDTGGETFTHVREYTLKELKWHLEKSGFKIITKKIVQSWDHGFMNIFYPLLIFPYFRDNIFIIAKPKIKN
jgi:SAM-dependent methyltransferase